MVNDSLEKYAIFSNNFKGLPDGWHNIRACNFLVGENSTGKSSFLQLIEIIDSRDHLVFLDICGIVEGVDSAFDVCSRSTDAKITIIGFLTKRKLDDENKEKKSPRKHGLFGRLITYKQNKNQLQIMRLSVLAGDKVVQLKRTGDDLSFRIDHFQYDPNKSYTENASSFEKIHFAKGKRFKREPNIEWDEIPDALAWISGFHNIVRREFGDDANYFLRNFSPLRSFQYAPIRGKSKRLFHGVKNEFSSTGEHFPFLVKKMLVNAPSKLKVLEKFGHESGLFDSISATSVTTKLKDKPFALQISKAGNYYYLDELGFGVGQILPIVADIIISSTDFAFLLQQPELHLHPKAQAALGDLFYTAASNGRTLVIETHSDFIIDRYRLSHKQSKEPPRSQIIFFSKDQQSGNNKATEIEMTPEGELTNIPDGYRDFFVNESLAQFENF